MKKNYILKKQVIITLLLLLSVHFCSIAQSRSSLLNGGKQFSNTISSSSTIQNLSNLTRQSSNVTPSIFAVCNIDQGGFDFPDSAGNTTFGQSFTAQCNSNIASISLTIGATVPSTSITANVYLGETLSGPSIGSTTLALGITGENIFIFSAPIPITSGQIYSVIFTSSTILSVPYSISDPYADGNAADGSGFQTGVDLVFKITTCDTPITPTFTTVAAICTGETLAALPTTSNNGISGTWFPALNNLATTTYTFTPDVLQCASTTTLTITVNPSTVNTTTVSVCDTYTWPYNGTTYTTSGIYIEPVPIVNGIVNDLTLWNTAATEGAATVSSSNLDGYPGQYAAGLALTIGGVNVNINAPGGIFNDANQIGTDFPDSPMTLSFSPAIYGVSGNFYFTDLSFNPVPGNITVTYSDGTVDTAIVNSPSDFFGYFKTGLISSVTISPTTNQGIWVTLDNLNIATNPTGCNKETLNLTVTPSTTTTTTISTCDSYTWSANSTTYTSSGTYTFISNCGTNILNLTIIPSTTNSTTVSVCDTYTWSVNSTTYTTSGIYTAVIGCLTETLNLTITPSTTTGSVTTSICAGDSYTWPANGTTYTTSQSGVTVVTGCNTATLNLTVNPLTNTGSVTTSICAGDSYTWPANGTTYTTSQSGVTVVTGCNTATLNLTVNPLTTTGSVTTSICDGDTYTWPANGTTYTTAQSGITVVTGCNTATLNLTVNPLTNTGSVTTSICAGDSYTWPANGTTYTTAQSGITVVTGCNTATLNLSITPITSTGSVSTSICDGDTYTWPENGVTYTTAQSGITVVTGCNTATLNLSITPLTTTGSVTTSICDGDSYTWPENGVTYTTSQTGVTVITGCNTATLNLTINTASTPAGSAAQTLNVPNASDATIASLVVSPNNVFWFASLADAQTGTNALPLTTVLTTGGTYWAVNVVGSCSSTPFAVTVTVALGNLVFDDILFSFYPNPTSSILNIKNSKEISGVSIFNLLGQLIIEKQTDSTEVQIDLLNLPSATYFVKVTSEGVEKIIKVIKQ